MTQQKKLWAALLLTGIVGGVVGMVLTELMHFIQHHAYGYAAFRANGTPISFREGAEQAAPLRRLAVLAGCGVAVGCGWWALQRFGRPLVSIQTALKRPLAGLPFGETVCHALLQIITVALGSPLGREVAPREMSSAFASLWIKRLGLDEDSARLLIACASGAGLAAVYNVPLAGTLFVLETLLGVWTQQAVAAALLTSVLATAVARLGLGDVQQYPLPELAVNQALLWWAAAAGPLLGGAAILFQRTAKPFPLLKRDNIRMVPLALAAFVAIGFISMFVPEILGNGKAGNQLVFAGLIDWQGSLTLTALKWAAVLLALAAGAYGGLITPSMMLGSTLAFASAALWNTFLPHMPSETAAVVGATVFLGVSMNMPLTAVVFILELTRAPAALLMPLCAGMATAVAAEKAWKNRQSA
ncbi:chloride channel protein [Neisseria lisongii]|uniref:Chloride channel protein n=1 Tax=Neisseria lisongii TaxID=2912188 RepID=A0AAW5ATZ5_9NEIS|nr:chloride channel protein [Neisseria lisongii]MCF7530470.1 chloride channel protein [Neisseria lisongii]